MYKTDTRFHNKQGTKYGITLGQNDGPYLLKDVMMTNRKSHKFINGNLIAKSTAQSILNSTHATVFGPPQYLLEAPEVYDDKLGKFTNHDEKFKSALNAAENLTDNSNVQSNLLRKLQEANFEYKKLIKEYKEELKQMNERINEANFENVRTIQPMIREFHQNLKVALQEAKNENYQLQREADQLTRDKIQLQQQLNFCEKRAQDLEKYVGIDPKLHNQASYMDDTIDF